MKINLVTRDKTALVTIEANETVFRSKTLKRPEEINLSLWSLGNCQTKYMCHEKYSSKCTVTYQKKSSKKI